jgi:hypothetical protein
VQVIQTEKQKDNLSKYCWDLSKITIAALVITPLARPVAVEALGMSIGIVVGVAFAAAGYVLDGMEVKV